MTDARQNSKETAPVAAIAVRLDGLRREVEALTGKLHALTSALQEHSAALDAMQELRRQVELILATLDDEDDASPNAWFWLTMSKQQHDEKLSELYDWVETVLCPQYPDYIRDRIKSCWPNHPEAKWELTWLYQLWSHAYLAKRSDPRQAADWHDRWVPGVIHRLREIMRSCERNCQLRPGSAAPPHSKSGASSAQL